MDEALLRAEQRRIRRALFHVRTRAEAGRVAGMVSVYVSLALHGDPHGDEATALRRARGRLSDAMYPKGLDVRTARDEAGTWMYRAWGDI